MENEVWGMRLNTLVPVPNDFNSKKENQNDT